MSLNDSMSDYERSQLAVWDYPVSDKFTKMWQAMQENKPPVSFQEAIERVRGKDDQTDGFAFLGMTNSKSARNANFIIMYHEISDILLFTLSHHNLHMKQIIY